jgi:hypothetical protein
LAAHEEQNRVEISLDHGQRLKLFSGISSRDRCVDADGIDAGLRNLMFVQQTGQTRKTDDRAIGETAL